MGVFDFQKLDVYRAAIQFAVEANAIAGALPTGHAQRADQLRRAADSIPANIAEASGREGRFDRRRFYTIARGSAYECAGLLDLLRHLALIDPNRAEQALALLHRIVAMLIRLTVRPRPR